MRIANEQHEDRPITVQELQRTLANPVYCLTEVAPWIVNLPTPALITEEEWIKANMIMLYQVGAEQWLRLLLANLKGDAL